MEREAEGAQAAPTRGEVMCRLVEMCVAVWYADRRTDVNGLCFVSAW